MIVGKTTSSISIPELFEKYSEVKILTAVFPEITSIPCRIQSPFRVDNNPSFSIYLDNDNHIKFKDFGDSDCRGSLLDLLCKKWNCTFNQVFDKILELMSKQEGSEVNLKMKQIKTLTRKESSELTKIQVKVRPWQKYDEEYWKSYGVELQWLKAAKVYAISHKIITKKDKETGKSQIYTFPAMKHAYAFTEYKGNKLSLKIYQPYSKDFKWCSCMDASVISLWNLIPEYGDRVVLCSSLKDSLCLSCQLHIPTLCLQGEGYNMSDTAINELKRRYKKVFICYDTDVAGLLDSENLAIKTGFKNIIPNLGECKDLSDWYKSLENKEDFKKLESLFY